MPDPDFIPDEPTTGERDSIVIRDEDSRITQSLYDALTERAVFSNSMAAAAAGATLSLTELSAAFRAMPVSQLRDERYLMGPAPRSWDYGAMSGYSIADHHAAIMASPAHTPVLDDSNMFDEVHQAFVDRWSRGLPNEDELNLWITACPCAGCAVALYEEAVVAVGPKPQGYGERCQCAPCVGWRTRMVVHIEEAIIRLARGNVSIRIDSNTLSPDIERAREMDYHGALREMQANIDPIVRQAARATPFERQRQRRGHPVPVNPLAEGWSENKWEA